VRLTSMEDQSSSVLSGRPMGVGSPSCNDWTRGHVCSLRHQRRWRATIPPDSYGRRVWRRCPPGPAMADRYISLPAGQVVADLEDGRGR
jgi:hypothetical protein